MAPNASNPPADFAPVSQPESVEEAVGAASNQDDDDFAATAEVDGVGALDGFSVDEGAGAAAVEGASL